MTLRVRHISAEAALQRAMGLCARREKTHREIKEKLFSWGISQRDAGQIISKLISEGFLNEERYARAFAHDKSRFHQWGPRKIEMALMAKGVSANNIALALKDLAGDSQREAMEVLIKRYSGRLKGLTRIQARLKLAKYLMGKGFEASKVWEVLGQED